MGTETKHTMTPWSVTGESKNGSYIKVRGTRLGDKWAICDCPYLGENERDKEAAVANAAFIVRAVNSHADLIAALEAIKSHFGRTLLIDSQYDHAALYSQGANAAFNQMAEIATAVLAKLEVTHDAS